MKILHIVSGRLSGGAARGALWLHKALRKIGIQSIVLSEDSPPGCDSDSFVRLGGSSRWARLRRVAQRYLDILPSRIYRPRGKTLFSTGLCGYSLQNHPCLDQADLVNLHWINDGLVNMMALGRIRKPVVWTLRDMWPMTGGCHHSFECRGYRERCGRCPQLESSLSWDLSRMIMEIKIRTLSRMKLTVVGASTWISECAKESSPFRNKVVTTIPNTVDADQFTPVAKPLAKQILGLPPKKCILVGAQDLSDTAKGIDEFVEAIKLLPHADECHLLSFGKRNDAAFARTGVPFMSLGFLYDPTSLRLAYSAADVFVAPSRAEAFGKTLVEAMACGTPVVAFNATGPRDIVSDRVNGYLAEPFDARDLARGIDWVIRHSCPEQLSRRARERFQQAFSPEIIARRYVELYDAILTGRYGREDWNKQA